jgi:hypothetical protein
MSEIPSLIGYHLNKLYYSRLDPEFVSNNNLSPTFRLKEDNLLSLSVSFKPIPICFCRDYIDSKHEKIPYSICYHILYILINYYHIDLISLHMFHKWSPGYFESLLSYFDNWLTDNKNLRLLRKKRKRKPYNFREETSNLVLTPYNIPIINPMLSTFQKDECAICLESLSAKPLALCGECYNYSHSKCLYQWSVRKQGCHLCRDNPAKSQETEEFPALH